MPSGSPDQICVFGLGFAARHGKPRADEKRQHLSKEETMHDLHRRAAQEHERAAHAHRTAAEHNEKGENETGNWHSQRALECSERAYELAKQAHSKSGQIVSV